MTQPNIFQEIEADIERQRLEDLWKRVGPAVIALAILVMLATGGYSAWKSWHTKKIQTATEQFLALAGDKAADDATILANLEKFAQSNTSAAQGAFALFGAAEIAHKQGDQTKALAYYASISENANIDASFRQLASLYAVELQMDNGNAAELLKKLEPLQTMNSAFRPSALELSGYLYLKNNEKDKARQIFSTLANDASLPRDITDRATTMLRYLAE